jgi:hypothetical protein
VQQIDADGDENDQQDDNGNCVCAGHDRVLR